MHLEPQQEIGFFWLYCFAAILWGVLLYGMGLQNQTHEGNVWFFVFLLAGASMVFDMSDEDTITLPINISIATFFGWLCASYIADNGYYFLGDYGQIESLLGWALWTILGGLTVGELIAGMLNKGIKLVDGIQAKETPNLSKSSLGIKIENIVSGYIGPIFCAGMFVYVVDRLYRPSLIELFGSHGAYAIGAWVAAALVGLLVHFIVKYDFNIRSTHRTANAGSGASAGAGSFDFESDGRTRQQNQGQKQQQQRSEYDYDPNQFGGSRQQSQQKESPKSKTAGQTPRGFDDIHSDDVKWWNVVGDENAPDANRISALKRAIHEEKKRKRGGAA